MTKVGKYWRVEMREKWLEKTEYVEATLNNQSKLVIWNDQTGDLLFGTCPVEHNIPNNIVRIERSGGASTTHPKVVSLLTELYDTLAGNEGPIGAILEHDGFFKDGDVSIFTSMH